MAKTNGVCVCHAMGWHPAHGESLPCARWPQDRPQYT